MIFFTTCCDQILRHALFCFYIVTALRACALFQVFPTIACYHVNVKTSKEKKSLPWMLCLQRTVGSCTFCANKIRPCVLFVRTVLAHPTLKSVTLMGLRSASQRKIIWIEKTGLFRTRVNANLTPVGASFHAAKLTIWDGDHLPMGNLWNNVS